MDAVKTGTLYMIGNAHLDPVWLWPWQEGFQEAKATFRSVLKLMREYDEFYFTSSSAALYEWVERNAPEMFEEIKQRVAEGRWEIVGGWWIQPDCNIPAGESFVRQGLYGQRYFREKLGVTATVGYNVDSFGHAASLPQILAKSGMSAYVFTRPHPHEQRLPARLFTWESDDGSRVMAFRIPYEYATGGKEVNQHLERCAAELRPSLGALMCFYGVGNHGGGPTRENIENIRRMSAESALPRLVFSTPSRYFHDITPAAPDLPVVHDELQHHASGCYSAHSGVKRWNRQAENLLLTAEKFSAIAAGTCRHPYPCDFDRAWKNVLFNQFHDILAGTSIEPAYDDAHQQYGEAMAIAGRNLNDAIQYLSWRMDIPEQEGSHPFVVFNPHSWVATVPVEVEFGRLKENDALFDAQGALVPFQRIRPLAATAGSRTRLAFLAELPPLGYQVYRVASVTEVPQPAPVQADDICIENEWLRLEINPETGCLRSLYDKREDFEWLRDEAARPVVLDDPSDTWSHGVLRYDRIDGAFGEASTRLIEYGPVRSTIRVASTYGRSRLTQDFTLYRDLARVDVRATVDWQEHFKVLKISFPINVFFSTATYEIPYGFIQRPANGEEEPGQSWVDLTGVGRNHGKRLGMSLINDSKYSFDVTEKVINMTVLRSPIYAHHDPYVPDPEVPFSFIDQGVQRFSYALLPHAGSWEQAGTVKRAMELNQPPVVQAESGHPGPLPPAGSYVDVNADNIVVTVLKQAEDGDGLIVRCFETSGLGGTATIRFPRWDRTIRADFRPSEIKTFRLPADPDQPVRETDLIEWE